MLALDEKVGKLPERQMATDQVASLWCAERELSCPTDFKQADPLLRLQRRIVNGQQLSGLWLLIQQQQDALGTDIQRVGLA